MRWRVALGLALGIAAAVPAGAQAPVEDGSATASRATSDLPPASVTRASPIAVPGARSVARP